MNMSLWQQLPQVLHHPQSLFVITTKQWPHIQDAAVAAQENSLGAWNLWTWVPNRKAQQLIISEHYKHMHWQQHPPTTEHTTGPTYHYSNTQIKAWAATVDS